MNFMAAIGLLIAFIFGFLYERTIRHDAAMLNSLLVL